MAETIDQKKIRELQAQLSQGAQDRYQLAVHMRAVEDTVEQNDNHFDGIINNLPPAPEKAVNAGTALEKPISVREQLETLLQKTSYPPGKKVLTHDPFERERE